MAASFFFYDLETSGISPRTARIMQFAGQRTDMDLNPIGEPFNALIKLTPDVVPEPDAIFITGITPQQTLIDGYTEAEFLKFFYDEVVKPDTIFIGYNSVRFDDEFMRFLHYRNFYDPYEWHWLNDCSRWDLLDAVRMTRALRPDGIVWPFAPNGKPSNRLEYMTSVNKLDHSHAHDALSDVLATIAVAKLIKTKQPDLFKYLLGCRVKKVVKEFVLKGKPFVYTTKKYPGESLHTSAAVLLTEHPEPGSAIVYDLRYDPTPFMAMSVDELVTAWRYKADPEAIRLPVKTLKYNRCPAVAPLGVIKDEPTQERLGLSLATVMKHWELLKRGHKQFAINLLAARAQLDLERDLAGNVDRTGSVDGRLYENLFDSNDKQAMRAVRAIGPSEMSDERIKFHDDRLSALLPLYKARNYPQSLSSEERADYDAFCHQQVFDGGQQSKLVIYFNRLAELAKTDITDQQKYLLEELQLYGQSIVPADANE